MEVGAKIKINHLLSPAGIWIDGDYRICSFEYRIGREKIFLGKSSNDFVAFQVANEMQQVTNKLFHVRLTLHACHLSGLYQLFDFI